MEYLLYIIHVLFSLYFYYTCIIGRVYDLIYQLIYRGIFDFTSRGVSHSGLAKTQPTMTGTVITPGSACGIAIQRVRNTEALLVRPAELVQDWDVLKHELRTLTQ